jgi:hypothetical protein
MRIRVLLLCGLGILHLVAGCQRDFGASGDVPVPDEMTLYSIDGRDFELGDGPKPRTDEVFYKYPVLGKIAVTDAHKRKEIIDALNEGMRSKDAKGAKCFWPRHAIRAGYQDKQVDYVICFECGYVDIYDGGVKPKVRLTIATPRDVFNKQIKEAGIPLAPFGRETEQDR